MKVKLHPLFIVLSILSLIISCQKKEQFPELSNISSDSIYNLEKSELKYINAYAAYLRTTTKDAAIHVEKVKEHEYYPWKVNLNKQKVDSFLVHLENTLTPEKIYKSGFGEFSPIKSEYVPYEANYVMADLLLCKLGSYKLINSDGEKVTIDDNDVSINKNTGSISFGLAKWDLQGQKIKGEVTLEISIPHTVFNIAVKPEDKGKTLDFGSTRITILEMENNVLHYTVEDDENYFTDKLIDMCMTSTFPMTFPEYFYAKLRQRPNLPYKDFIAEADYFELGKQLKDDTKNVHVLYFDSCDPATLYLYGYKKTDVSKRDITIPIDVEIH